MKFLLYASTDQDNVGISLGTADYSYFFLLRAFSPLLAELGEVIVLKDPTEANAINARCLLDGEDCVLLSFTPPHKTPLGLACPTVPVFAWEYPDIPEQIEEISWLDDARHDWRHVFRHTGRAIALSSHTVAAVKRSMGNSFPIVAIASPIPAIAAKPQVAGVPPSPEGRLLRVTASVADSLRMGLNVNSLIYFDDDDGTSVHESDLEYLPESAHHWESAETAGECAVSLDEPLDAGESAPLACGWDIPPAMPICTRLRGVVYTAVLIPASGRKNWEDLISAFCWTFRDTEDATLVLKLGGTDLTPHHHKLLMLLSKMSPLKCRVIAIYGYLSNEAYADLIAATTYYVNTSLGEGLCLPLVEFLSQGVPAIAPDNTAMADYVRDDFAFVVDSYPGVPTVWPHGDDEVNRTTYHQLNWQSLVDAYSRSYDVAYHDPTHYQQMSRRAMQAMQAYCGHDTIKSRLQAFLCPLASQPLAVQEVTTPPAWPTTPEAAL